jgi:gamma-glutamylaminecyclotransferase
MHTVFVYGSLKRGFHNHSVMVASGGQLIAKDSIPAGMFKMLDLGAFPALVEADGGPITGEVYRVATLERLDMLEGYPRFYNRRIVTTDSGQRAWIYFLENDRSNRDVVASGKWEQN